MQRPGHALQADQFRRGSKQSQPKVAKHHLLTLVYQEIFRFDIAMNNILIMRVLKCCCCLFDMTGDRRERKASASGIQCAQVTTGSIVHYEKRYIFFNPTTLGHCPSLGNRKLKNTYDVRM